MVYGAQSDCVQPNPAQHCCCEFNTGNNKSGGILSCVKIRCGIILCSPLDRNASNRLDFRLEHFIALSVPPLTLFASCTFPVVPSLYISLGGQFWPTFVVLCIGHMTHTTWRKKKTEPKPSSQIHRLISCAVITSIPSGTVVGVQWQ